MLPCRPPALISRDVWVLGGCDEQGISILSLSTHHVRLRAQVASTERSIVELIAGVPDDRLNLNDEGIIRLRIR